MKTKAKKTTRIVLLSLLLLLVIAAVWFFQFRNDGYLMTVPYRPSFEKIADNVYINKGNAKDPQEILDLIEQAKERVTAFYGDLQFMDKTMIIICDDAKLTERIGEKETKNFPFPKKHDYICISNEYFILDIVAHEITHAELHSRLTSKALMNMPVWFDEGVATQNDYREKYSEDEWIRLTDNGKNTIPLEEMDISFATGTTDEKVFRYICAKHEVAEWIEAHGMQGFFELLDKLNNGEDFHTAYGK